MSTPVQLFFVLSDNYVFLVHGPEHEVLLFDPGDHRDIEKYINTNGLKLTTICITHHHLDHVQGVKPLLKHDNISVYAPRVDQGLFPFEILPVGEGDRLRWHTYEFEIWDVPGHTLDHVLYYEHRQGWVFSGDVLFGLGCGRLFEGTAEQMFQSLQRLKVLPDETLVFCTHEYTERNLAFAETQLTADELNSAAFQTFKEKILARRRAGQPTVPLRLGDEKRWNPFLRADSVEEFARRRRRRDQF